MATSTPHDATKMLIADHRALEELFGRLEATTPRAVKRRAALVERIIHKLSLHTATEEAEFYPELRLLRPELTDDVLVALEEHHAVKRTLLELERMLPGDERYMAKARV